MRKNKNLKSFTLIEVLVGTFLMLVVFSGIFGAYQLSLKVIGLSKTKIIATAVANGQIEKIRNLPYGSIGVRGSFPDGVLEAATTTIQNNIQYTIKTRVDYIVDPADGTDPDDGDDCPNDYKRAEVKVSWSGKFSGQIILVTDVAPKNLAQECSTGGGILSVSVFDAYGIMVPFPLIEIKNPVTDETLKTATPFEGQYHFSLATSTYKVVVSKNGYSTERTYGTDEIATPNNPHPMILEEKLTPISFSIDKLSNFSVDTLSSWGSGNFSDSFLNENKISEKSDLLVSGGKVELATSDEGYLSNGYLISTEILSTNLIRWDKLSFSDSELTDTNIKYQIYYASDTDWYLVSDSDLSGNSVGFADSPVDLSDLSTTTYDKLKIRGNFSSVSTTETPTLYDWQISWVTSEAFPIPNASFNLYGNKTIGKDSHEDPVYKYSTTTTTNSSGHKDIQNLEWDLYTFSVAPASGLNLINIQPSPQPVNLIPDTNSSVNLYLGAQNSLLLTVQDISNLEPIFSATVRMYNMGLGYDQTQNTNIKGQTYFIPLSNATYNLEISCSGYLPVSTVVSVSGYETKTIKLEVED